MPTLSRPGSRRGSTAARRRSHRRSVLLYLVALALVPSMGIPVLAGFFIDDRLDEAVAARRIGDAMTMVGELDSVRRAISDEAVTSAVVSIAGRYGLTVEEVDEILGGGRIVPLETARSRADEALASMQPDSETRPAMDTLQSDLRKVRVTADDSFEDTSSAAGSAWEMYETFAILQDKLRGIEDDAIERVVTGYYGSGSSELLTTVAQLQRVAATVDAGTRQASYLQGLFAATTPEDRAAVLSGLRRMTVTWEALSADLPSHLSDDIRESWQEVIDTPEVEEFQQFLADLAEPGRPDVEPSTMMSGATESARTAIELAEGLTGIVQESVAEGVTVAHADQAEAERRVGVAVGTTLFLLLVTSALVVLIGGTIRRRLRGLASAAKRFSAGQLEPMIVHGPQEIAVASAALNDAVRSLRRVAVQAERLSVGDLDAPELQEPAPGALGSAVHSSVQRIVAAVREGEKLREALAHQAAHDALTDLPNRAESEHLLTRALARSHRTDARIAVLFVDLDRFKQCNDALGHAAGDHVLRTVAARMTEVVRPGDTVCRLGGDEFIVVVEPVGTEQGVVDVANRIVKALAEPVTYDDVSFVVGASIGVAISDHVSDAGSLLREADSAMYRAKATARGTVEIFDEHLRDKLQREADFRLALTEGMARGELELHYQPVLDIPSGRLRGLEALARWHRPGVGMVGPDEFIPMAEASDLIIEIGQWALHTATAQLAEWSADPAYASVQVAVNLSGRHFSQPAVVDDVRSALSASGLQAGRLVVEITESIPIDSPTTIGHLDEIAAMGVRIALDDFGTGYTSIGQLLHLPVHILKIDRSFVSGTNEDGSPVLERSGRIIDLIVEVAHSLHLGVVAEGVETASQLANLVGAACERAQGDLFSRPLPVADVAAWVTSHTAETERDGAVAAAELD